VTITDSIGCSVVNELIDPDCDPSDNPTPAALGLYILPTSVAPEERVCLPVKTTNFSDIESFQFSLSWNPAIASNASIQNIGLPWLGANNFNITTPGTLSVNWMDILGPDDIAFLPNGATLFELCLDANATGGASEIAFGDQPLAIQAVNGAGTILEVNTSNGYLEVVNTNGSPVTINVPDVSVEPNQEVCLSVQADNFFDVVGAQFTITFDPTLVEYTGVVPLTLSTVTDNNFGTSSDNLANGTLPFSWYDPSLSGVSLPTGSTLFDVCFTAIANGGTSVIGIESDPVTVEFVKQGLSVLPYLVNDGSISIESTDEATQAVLRIGSTEGETGQLRCVDITAEQIEDLISMQFSIAWDPSVLDLETIFTDNGLPGFTSNNFGLNFVEQGQLAVAWFNPSLEPVTLDQGTELFELCFNLIGPSGSSSAINFAQTPTAIEFVNSNTNTMSFSGIEGTIAIVENVWPGDTDNNEQVDHFDLLNIGLGFNATGPARATSSTDWTGFAAADWPQFTPSTGTNYRHIDANGDGVINSTDIVGIAFNWGETTNFWDGGAQENNFTQSVLDNVPLYVQSDTILPNTNVSFDIILGEENFQAEDIYGIAFSVYYDASVVVPGSASFDFTQSWLAGSNNHILNIARDFYQAGRIDMAIVRTDQNNVSGFGKIGAFSLTIEDVIFRNAEYEMFFTIDNVRLINNNEVELPITPRSTTALIDLITSTEQADLTSQIDIYPNPTADQLSVVGKDLTIEQIRLFDYTGKELPLPLTDPSVLSLSGLPGGIYMLQVTTDKGVLVERIVKTNH
ncbi:MAG: cohesin domain-containing protein, partial [Bacteroidota bacterium]